MPLRPDQFRFQPGPISRELTVERLESLRQSTAANKPAPTGHINCKVRQSPNGFTIEANAGRGGGAGVGSLRIVPIRPASYATAIPTGAHCWVTYGLVDLKAPIGIEDPVMLAEGTNYVYIEITLNNDWAVQSSEIKTATTMPTNPVVDPTTGEAAKTWYYQLGTIAVSGGVVGIPSNTGSGSLSVESYQGGFQYIEPTATQEGGLATVTRIRFYR